MLEEEKQKQDRKAMIRDAAMSKWNIGSCPV